jgi:hypothetical protein
MKRFVLNFWLGGSHIWRNIPKDRSPLFLRRPVNNDELLKTISKHKGKKVDHLW